MSYFGEFRSKLKSYQTLLRLSVFILVVGIFFQNCGGINLHSSLVENGSVAQQNPPKPTFLKPPTSESTIFRAVFMMDMSFSMIGDVCTSSPVDMVNVVPDRVINACSGPSGVDYNMKRISSVRRWIQQTVEGLRNRQDYNPLETFKVMLVPFSGPGAQSYLIGVDSKFPEALKFVDVDSALILLQKLEVVNNCYLDRDANCEIPASLAAARPTWNWSYGESSSFMGTSVPANGLRKIKDVLNVELNSLGSAKSQSRFELVYLSDGVPKPRVDHMLKAAQIVWDNNARQNSCSASCSDAYRDLISFGGNNYCTDGYTNCIELLSSTSLLQNDTTCELGDESCMRDAFTVGVQRFWGDAKDNDLLSIFRHLNSIKNIFLVQNASVQFRHSFVRIDSETADKRTMASDLKDNMNWIERSKRAFSNNFRYGVINSEQLPFNLFPALTSSDSYQLKHIVAVNLTTRVNSAGALEVDSDADGLFDSQEVSQLTNTNPLNARSNGFCLDSITFKMNGCVRVSCDPQVDEDGDGLNECEEKTIGTSSLDIDTDDDGIPDGLEVLFGYNTMVNDRFKDNNFDGKNNYVNFEFGLLPMTLLSQVNSSYLNRIGVQFAGTKFVINERGERVQVSGYAIQLHSLPLVFPRLVTSESPMYKSLTKTPENKWPFSLMGSNHIAGNNFIYILGKVENAQNPKDFYWIQKRIEAPYGKPVRVDFDLDLMDYLIVPDPQWTGE